MLHKNEPQRLGDLFGEMGMTDGLPRSASIIALEKTTCPGMDASSAESLKGSSRFAFTSILYRIFDEIQADRLRKADAELVRLGDENSILRENLSKANENMLQIP